MIGSDEIIRDVVAGDSRAAAVFQRHGIDFCCGGNRTIAAGCVAAGITAAPVVAELAALAAGERTGPRFGEWDAGFLADYVVTNHHSYVRRALPVIAEHLDKVARAHGERHPETVAIAREWTAVAAELEEHMAKEEEVLFPYVRALADAARTGRPVPSACFASAAAPIRVMELEHERAGEAMRRIRFLSDGYTPPADACLTYRVTYEELAEFERDLHQHVNLENNLLFPKALELEGRLG
jgi:regulator of cell morphogenesis and NO signaling